MRVASEVILGSTEFEPSSSQYISFQYVAGIQSYYDHVSSIFVLLCYLRALKFLRIPSNIGPTAMVRKPTSLMFTQQSILDTLNNTSFLVFLLIFFFVIFSFAMSFHLSFGKYIYGLRDVQHSLLTIWILLLGGLDYESLEDTNPIFGKSKNYGYLI